MQTRQISGRLTFTILSISLLTVMAGAAMAPALWAVKAHFTGKPDLIIQFIVSLPALFIIVTNLCFPLLCRVAKTKSIAVAGLVLYVVSGTGAFFSGKHLDNTHPARLAGRVCRNDNAVVNGTVVLLFPARRPIPLDGTVRRDEPGRRRDRDIDRWSAGEGGMELRLPGIFNGAFCPDSCSVVPAQ